MKRALLVVFAAALTACSSAATVNTAMAGTWFGTYTVTFAGQSPFSYTGQIIFSVAGDMLTATDVCPDNSGTLVATGSGNTATWTGTLVCPAHDVGGCPTLAYTFTSATATLDSAGTTMMTQGSGTYTGCSGSSGSFTFTFSGMQQ